MSEKSIVKVSTRKLNCLVENLMIQMGISDPKEAIRRVVSSEWVLTQVDYSGGNGSIILGEDNLRDLGVVISDGTTGSEWVKRFKARGFLDRKCKTFAERLLKSRSFKPTNGVEYHITLIRGALWENKERICTREVLEEAERRKLEKPNAEVACLLRDKFSDKAIADMEIQTMAVMSKPINVDGDLILTVDSSGYHPRLDVAYGNSMFSSEAFGFVFCQPSIPKS